MQRWPEKLNANEEEVNKNYYFSLIFLCIIGGKGIGMDDETVKHLWALPKMNDALIEGLKLAVFALMNKDDLSEERLKSTIESLERLITQSEEIYAEAATTKH